MAFWLKKNSLVSPFPVLFDNCRLNFNYCLGNLNATESVLLKRIVNNSASSWYLRLRKVEILLYFFISIWWIHAHQIENYFLLNHLVDLLPPCNW